MLTLGPMTTMDSSYHSWLHFPLMWTLKAFHCLYLAPKQLRSVVTLYHKKIGTQIPEKKMLKTMCANQIQSSGKGKQKASELGTHGQIKKKEKKRRALKKWLPYNELVLVTCGPKSIH